MTKQMVGIEITAQCVRMAIFAQTKEPPYKFTTVERPIDADNSDGDISQLIVEMLGSRPGFADRLCSTLPNMDGFVRQLNFPFTDRRKIEAAVRIELAAKLPVDISDHIIATSAPMALDKGVMVTAATATQHSIATALKPYDDGQLPLHILGLAPFTEACGLHNLFSAGFLVHIHEHQLIISLIQAGQVTNFTRHNLVTPEGESISDASIAEIITSKIALLCHSAKVEQQPLCLIGNQVTVSIKEALKQQELVLFELPLRDHDNNDIDPAFLPVCALALAADQESFNFRRGPFTLKSEWAALKKHLYTGGALLAVTLLLLGGTAIYNYQHKNKIAEDYRHQITQVFRQTLPEAKVIVDVPRQLQAALQQLQQTGQLVGLDKSTSALAVLWEVSAHTPKNIKVDIQKFNYESQALTLDGITNSFDSVNQLAGELRKAPIFTEVRIADAKMGIDGNNVTFRLQLAISQQGGQQ
ncbi:MAG: type II secretion system protein GspL [Desulfuromonas sp.]|nr:type II secretion system protein GspL [Desulfuromonas sp.]